VIVVIESHQGAVHIAPLFLQATDSGFVLVSRNSRDLDLLLQLKPQVAVLF